MPHILSETPTFDADITVPDGTDAMANAAEVVEALSQKLANRTEYLRQNSPQLDADNVFTGDNTFAEPLIVEELAPAGGTLTVNATSTALTGALTIGGTVYSSSGPLDVSAQVELLNTLKVAGKITANAGIKADDGSVEIEGTTIVTNERVDGSITLHATSSEIAYDVTVLRYVNIPMCLGLVVDGDAGFDFVADSWVKGSVDSTIRFPIDVPRGATALGIGAVWRASVAPAANSASMWRTAQGAWTAGLGTLAAIDTPTQIGATLAQTAFSSSQVAHDEQLLAAPLTISNRLESYWIDVVLPSGSTNTLYALRYFYPDPGPRNG